MQLRVSKKTIQGVQWTSLSAVINALAKLLQVAILTRFLIKEDFGLVAVALLINSFCAIFTDMGITSAVLHFPKINKEEYSSLYWFSISSGVLFTAIVAVLARPISNYYAQPELLNIVPFTALNIFFASISGLQRTMQQKQLNFKFISVVEIVSAFVMLITSALLAYCGYGVYSLVYSTLLNGFLIACIYVYHGVFIKRNIAFHFNILEVKRALKIGSFQVGSSVLDFISTEFDSLIISSAYSFEFLGVYTLCKQIVLRIFTLINPIITKVLTPILSTYQSCIDVIRKRYLEVLGLLVLINFPIYFLVALNAREILGILYGESYITYSFILILLVANYFLLSYGNPAGSLIVALGRTDLGFKWTIFRVIASVVVLYILSMFGFSTFLIGVLILTIVNTFFYWYLVYRRLIQVSYIQIMKPLLLPCSICIISMPLFFLFDSSVSSVFSLFIKSVIFLIIYIIIVYKYKKEELNTILFR